MTPEQSAAVANIREAIDNQPAHRAQRDDPVPVKTDDLRTLLSALDAAQAAEQAIDDELVTIGATLSTYPTPRDAVRALIDWHVAVALDPAVSSDAQALIDRGAAQAASREVPPPDDPPIPDPREETRRALIEWAMAYGRRVAAQAPREVPRLTERDMVACLVAASCIGTVKMSYDSGPYEITRTSINADRLCRAVESRVRELCGVAP